MKSISTAVCVAALSLSLVGSACSQTAQADAPQASGEAAKLLVELRKLYPEPDFKSVRESVVPGLYEVTVGQNVGYMDRTGRYMIQGQLLDLQSKTNLSEQALREAMRIDVSALPLSDAIKVVRGDGSRSVYIFADPDCPYCQDLEASMATLNNVTAYVFLLPLSEIHPDAYRKSVGIWCSSDRSKTWLSAMLKQTPVASAECDNPIDRNAALARKLGVDGTPTVFLPSGDRYDGGLSAETLDSALGAKS